jgi:hypothetical protein
MYRYHFSKRKSVLLTICAAKNRDKIGDIRRDPRDSLRLHSAYQAKLDGDREVPIDSERQIILSGHGVPDIVDSERQIILSGHGVPDIVPIDSERQIIHGVPDIVVPYFHCVTIIFGYRIYDIIFLISIYGEY